jgi:hypothetical protein
MKAMVLLFISDSREISFRIDDCLSQNNGRLLPIGVMLFYVILMYLSIELITKTPPSHSEKGVM